MVDVRQSPPEGTCRQAPEGDVGAEDGGAGAQRIGGGLRLLKAAHPPLGEHHDVMPNHTGHQQSNHGEHLPVMHLVVRMHLLCGYGMFYNVDGVTAKSLFFSNRCRVSITSAALAPVGGAIVLPTDVAI